MDHYNIKEGNNNILYYIYIKRNQKKLKKFNKEQI